MGSQHNLWHRLFGRTRLGGAFFGGTHDRDQIMPLYHAAVATARQADWYRDGGVSDTREGRFETLIAVLALVMLRLEDLDGGARASVLLGEAFVDDMDGQLRQFGIGDMVVGKHVGKLMGALGGRLGAYRDAHLGLASWRDAVARNWPEAADRDWVAARLSALDARLRDADLASLYAGKGIAL